MTNVLKERLPLFFWCGVGRIVPQSSVLFDLKANAYILICFTMASSPLLRVGLRWSLNPMLSMKKRSASKISCGVCPLSTRNRRAISPFTMSVSELALNNPKPD